MTDPHEADHDIECPKPIGHHDVDAALATLDGLAERPVEEHPATLAAAHDSLRQLLTDAGEGRPAS